MVQPTAGTDLATTWDDASIPIARVVNVDWDKAGGFADIASRVLRVDLSSSLLDNLYGLPLLGKVPPATARLTLDNRDNYFSPDNVDSAIHTDIQYGIFQVPVQIELGYYSGAIPETLKQFTGYIMESKESEGASKQVVFTCVDNLGAIQQRRHNTVLYLDKRVDEIIHAYLDLWSESGHTEDYAHSIIPYSGMDFETILSECQKVAAADGGWIRATKEGVVVFERMTHWLEANEHTVSNVTLDTGEAWRMSDTIRWQEAYTKVTVPWTPRTGAPLDVIYQAINPIELRPGETKTIVAVFDYAVSDIVTPVANTDYFALTSGMRDIKGDLTIAVTLLTKRASIELTNNHANQKMHILELQLRGWLLMGRQTSEITKTHEAGFLTGQRDYLYPKNFYMQTEIQAERQASFLRDLLQRPRRLIGWRGPGVPFLELGDRVHVDHKTATYSPGIDIEGYVVGLNQSYSAPGMYEMPLVILPVTDLWAEAAYFLLGASVYKDVGSTPLFY